jgi:sec-independent protein translocase protein TatC
MTFLEHLLELRSKILLSAVSVGIGALVSHYYHQEIIDILLRPIADQKLFFLSPLDPLFFVLKIDLYGGGILALPIINWSIFSFVRPAMTRSGWLFFSSLYFMATALIIGGLAYAYFFIVPASLKFLLSINIPGIENMITATSYLNFFLAQSFIVAVVSQIPLFVIAGSAIGALNTKVLASQRGYIYIAGLIALAIMTPTSDIFSLGMVAAPACLIFEGSLVVARMMKRFRRPTKLAR